MANGVIVIIMTLPPIFKKVSKGKESAPTEAVTKKMADKIGMKILSQRYQWGFLQLFLPYLRN